MAAPLVLFAALLAWHASPLLQAANLLAVCGAVAIGALRRTERRVAHAHVDDYVAGAVTAGAATIVGAVELMQSEVPWRDVRRGLRAPRVAGAARGLVLGLPFLLLFGVLFAAADAVFENLLASAVPIFRASGGCTCSSWSASRGRRRGSCATCSRTGRTTVSCRRARRRLASARPRSPLRSARSTCSSSPSCSCSSAISSAEAGSSSSATDLTYAEYARHGFFELVVVAVLVLPLMLGADAVANGTRRQVRLVAGSPSR